MMTEAQRANCRLQFISHFTPTLSYLDGIRMALDGGCRWIQLRMKEADDTLFLSTATEAQRMCREAEATFIIDDRVDIALRIKADGVHLGKNDMPIDEARHILGPEAIIGGTANTIDDIMIHHRRGADYIGCGPFRFTTTKQRLAPVLGLDGYRQLINGMHEHGINLPIVAIGGIGRDDIAPIMLTGVTGIALSGSILRAENAVEETRNILQTINNAIK